MCGSSVLDPRALRANRVTRKKPSLKASSVKLMIAPGKAAKETTKLDNTQVQKPQTVLRLGTVNVGTLIGRSAEVVETLGRWNVDALQEVSYKKEGTKIVKGGEYEYKLYWMGEEVGQGGVAIMIKSELMQKVVEVKRVSP